MVTRKRGKMSRHRGSHTHGYGAMKKHRGAGNKGGKGNAGSGKRADSKKPSIWKNKYYFGKYGFTPVVKKSVCTINVGEVAAQLEKLVAENKATVANNIYTVDLTALGYDKLLGSGEVTNKLKITVTAASAHAVEKIIAAGGEVLGVVAQSTKESQQVQSDENG